MSSKRSVAWRVADFVDSYQHPCSRQGLPNQPAEDNLQFGKLRSQHLRAPTCVVSSGDFEFDNIGGTGLCHLMDMIYKGGFINKIAFWQAQPTYVVSLTGFPKTLCCTL